MQDKRSRAASGHSRPMAPTAALAQRTTAVSHHSPPIAATSVETSATIKVPVRAVGGRNSEAVRPSQGSGALQRTVRGAQQQATLNNVGAKSQTGRLPVIPEQQYYSPSEVATVRDFNKTTLNPVRWAEDEQFSREIEGETSKKYDDWSVKNKIAHSPFKELEAKLKTAIPGTFKTRLLRPGEKIFGRSHPELNAPGSFTTKDNYPVEKSIDKHALAWTARPDGQEESRLTQHSWQHSYEVANERQRIMVLESTVAPQTHQHNPDERLSGGGNQQEHQVPLWHPKHAGLIKTPEIKKERGEVSILRDGSPNTGRRD